MPILTGNKYSSKENFIARILLTGATGLLGSHLSEQILAQGHQLTALVRGEPAQISQRCFLGITPQPVQFEDGDLNHLQIKGHFDVVIHAAAMTSSDASQQELIWQTNVLGTQNLFQHLQGRYGKWIQISSVSTLCDGTHVRVDETHQGQARKTPYAQSKLAADQWLESQAGKPVLFIHPCYLLGRYDSKPSSGAIFHALKLKRLKSYQNNQKNFVAAEDVAAGILKAMDADQAGHFILGNENVELKVFFQKIATEMKIPFELSEENLTAESMDWAKEFCSASEVSWEKAQKCFGYQPQVSLDQMIRETMDYFEKFKMLRRSK